MSKAYPAAGECFRLSNHHYLRVTCADGYKITCSDLLTGANRYFEVRLAGHWYEFDASGRYANSYRPTFEVVELTRDDVKKLMRDSGKALYRKADVAREEARKFAVHAKETLAAL